MYKIENDPKVGWGLRPCEGWGLLVPRGLYGWGGFGGSGKHIWDPYYCEVDELTNIHLFNSAVFVWDLENEIGFSYVPTYLAW